MELCTVKNASRSTVGCTDEVTEECSDKEGEWTLKIEKLRQKLEEYSAKMFHLKGHITVMSKSEKKLTLHIKELSTVCADMDASVSDLDKVRDAIHIFDTCAGLGRPSFHIPLYAEAFKSAVIDTVTKSNAEVDAALNALCAGVTFKNLTARAAEMSELMQQSVDGMPTHNPSLAPLYGTCPHCDGLPSEPDGVQHASGYFRNCWPGEAHLDGPTMKSDCGDKTSMKVVLCVVDRMDGLNSGGGSGSSSSSSSSSTSSESTTITTESSTR